MTETSVIIPISEYEKLKDIEKKYKDNTIYKNLRVNVTAGAVEFNWGLLENPSQKEFEEVLEQSIEIGKRELVSQRESTLFFENIKLSDRLNKIPKWIQKMFA